MSKHNVPFVKQIADKILIGDDCWMWTASRQTMGYPQLRWRGKMVTVHTLMYEFLVGPIPEGMSLDHTCHNEAVARGECDGGPTCIHHACCNPKHLVPKPQGDNLMASPLTQCAINKAKTECKRGHPFDEENTGWRRGKWRYCRTCERMGKEGRAEWDRTHA